MFDDSWSSNYGYCALALMCILLRFFLDPPVFTIKPKDVYVRAVNEEVSLPCDGSGQPTPNIFWRKVSFLNGWFFNSLPPDICKCFKVDRLNWTWPLGPYWWCRGCTGTFVEPRSSLSIVVAPASIYSNDSAPVFRFYSFIMAVILMFCNTKFVFITARTADLKERLI